jgi:small subunit ribosomal protein S18
MEPVRRKRFQKRKSCKFCEDKVEVIDYKDVKLLKMFITERGKIIPRRITGNCAKHQRSLTTSIKRARNIALIAFASSH